MKNFLKRKIAISLLFALFFSLLPKPFASNPALAAELITDDEMHNVLESLHSQLGWGEVDDYDNSLDGEDDYSYEYTQMGRIPSKKAENVPATFKAWMDVERRLNMHNFASLLGDAKSVHEMLVNEINEGLTKPWGSGGYDDGTEYDIDQKVMKIAGYEVYVRSWTSMTIDDIHYRDDVSYKCRPSAPGKYMKSGAYLTTVIPQGTDSKTIYQLEDGMGGIGVSLTINKDSGTGGSIEDRPDGWRVYDGTTYYYYCDAPAVEEAIAIMEATLKKLQPYVDKFNSESCFKNDYCEIDLGENCETCPNDCGCAKLFIPGSQSRPVCNAQLAQEESPRLMEKREKCYSENKGVSSVVCQDYSFTIDNYNQGCVDPDVNDQFYKDNEICTGNDCLEEEEEEDRVIVSKKIAPGQTEPPLLADGKSETALAVSAHYADSGEAVPLTFSIGYTRTQKKGQITSVSGDAQSGYIVHYRTADLGEVEGQPADSIDIKYKKKDGKSDKDSYEILLYTETSSDMSVSHPGFVSTKAPLVFEGEETEVFVYTDVAGRKVPVANAKIDYESVWPAYTNRNGIAKLKSVKKVYGNKTRHTEVQLGLNAQMKEWQEEANRHYTELEVPNTTVNDFIANFAAHLAKADTETETEKQQAILKSLKYALFFMNQGNVFADGTSDMIGNTLGAALWDTLEFAASLVDFAGAKREQLEKAGKSFIKNAAKEAERLKELETLKKLLSKIPDGFFKYLKSDLLATITAFIPRFNPAIIKDIFKEIFGALYEPVTETGIMKVGEIGFNELGIDGIVAGYFLKGHKDFDKKLLERIADKIKSNQFKSYDYITDSKIALAKSSYDDFVNSYQFKMDRDYKVTMFKAYSDFLRASVVKGLELTVKPLAPLMKAINEVMEGLDVVLQGARVVPWYNAFNDNQDIVTKTVSEMMELELAGPVAPLFPAPSAMAAEDKDIWDQLYESQKSKDDPDRQIVIDYALSKSRVELYEQLDQAMTIISDFEPEDEEVQQIKEEISGKLADYKQAFKENSEAMKTVDLTPPKGKGFFEEHSSWLTILLAFIGALVLLILIWKLGKWIAILLILAVIIGIAYFFLGGVPDMPDYQPPATVDDRSKTSDVDTGGEKKFMDKSDMDTMYGEDPLSASSTLIDDKFYYGVYNINDDDPATSWVPSSPTGEWVQMNFPEAKKLSGILIYPGYAASEDLYFKNNRLRKIRVEFSDGFSKEFTLEDEFRLHELKFPEVTTSYIRIVIDEVYPGSKYNDTAIAEVIAE